MSPKQHHFLAALLALLLLTGIVSAATFSDENEPNNTPRHS